MSSGKALGRIGEESAAQAALSRGMTVLARNFRAAGGEIDLVAEDGRVIVFVEVKARSGAKYGDGGEAVSAAKMRRLARAAAAYLQGAGLLDRPCRGDVALVARAGGGPEGGAADAIAVTWMKNAMPLGDFA